MTFKLQHLLALTFVLMWVGGEIAHATYNEKLYWSILMTIAIGYLNNAHGLIWQWMKGLRK